MGKLKQFRIINKGKGILNIAPNNLEKVSASSLSSLPNLEAANVSYSNENVTNVQEALDSLFSVEPVEPIEYTAGQNITINNNVIDVNIPNDTSISAFFAATDAFTNMAFDFLGNVYVISSNNTVSKITPAGVSTIFATIPSVPKNITIDTQGNVYTCNQNNTVSKITPTGVISTLGTTGENPFAIVIDSQGNVYTCNYNSNNVSKITPEGISTILGSTGQRPFDIAVDFQRNIYTVDSNSNTVTKITPAGVSSVLGITGGNPRSIAIDTVRNIYTCNESTNDVSRITQTGISTIYGTTGPTPKSITIDSSRNIYSCGSDELITKITPAGVSTIVGNTGPNPFFIKIDFQGIIYTSSSQGGITKTAPARKNLLEVNSAGNIIRADKAKQETATLKAISNPTAGYLLFDIFNLNRPTIHNGEDWKELAYKDEVNSLPVTTPNSLPNKLWTDGIKAFFTNALGINAALAFENDSLEIIDNTPSPLAASESFALLKTYNIGSLSGFKMLSFEIRGKRVGIANEPMHVEVRLKEIDSAVNYVLGVSNNINTANWISIGRTLNINQTNGTIEGFSNAAEKAFDLSSQSELTPPATVQNIDFSKNYELQIYGRIGWGVNATWQTFLNIINKK